MFKKLAVFTDIHFGLKSNSKLHNDDCEEFVDWYIDLAKQHGCETGMFCGDWHHNRNSVNITTMDASIRSLEKIGKAFDNFYFFPGNHDLYYKDSRDIQSTEFGRFIPGITMVNEITQIDDVVMVPWLVGNEWKKVGKMKCKYMFGHFELPNFFMNAMVEMPDTGELSEGDLQGIEHVFTGHFHKRQTRGNITYMGNAFPHNYSDAWDDERGVMILDWGTEPKYVAWPDAPKYKTLKLGQLLDSPDKYLLDKTYARVTLDIEISYEEANFIRENFMERYPIRELSLIQQKLEDTQLDESVEINFESVDTIVNSQLQAVQSDFYDKELLMDIYRKL